VPPGRRRIRRAARPAAVTALVAGSAALLAVGTSRVHEWVVMTDELLYAKLARHIGTTGSPLPELHGQHVGFLGVVYPILISPFYGGLDAVSAFHAAHIVNAVLFASAAIPAYLLARRIVPAAWAFPVSVLVIAIPWSVGAAFVMSEAAAYPVFLWAVLGCHAALTEPSPRRDAVALGALVLAYLTRPQFLFLVAVLPLSALLVEGPRRALARHRLAASVYALAVVALVPLAALGEGHRLLGDYGVTATHGSLLPAGVWKAAALHLDVLAVGLGVVPFLLGAAWAGSSLVRRPPPLRALAALTAVSLPLLALETASYDLRFGGPGVIRDRYLFYLAPLLLTATVACLQEHRLPLAGIALATAFFAGTAALADFTPLPGLSVDSPESVLNGLIHDESAGLPAGVFVALCGVLLGLICLMLAVVPRPAAALGVTLAIFAFGGSVAGYAFERLLTSRTITGFPVTGRPATVRDWVDRSTSAPAALLAYPTSSDWGRSAEAWWDVEFWNDSITQAFVVPGGTFTYTPFPSRTLAIDFRTGRFAGTTEAPPFVLVSPSDSRFQLAGRQAAANVGLTLVLADRPYRALWATRGLSVDGWTRPGRAATVRVYAEQDAPSRLVRVTALLDSPPEATAPVRYRFGPGGGSIAPGARAEATAETCVRAGGHADLTLDAGRAATIPGPPLGPQPGPPRDVGVVLSAVQVARTGAACS
jgi:hypothetical protein